MQRKKNYFGYRYGKVTLAIAVILCLSGLQRMASNHIELDSFSNKQSFSHAKRSGQLRAMQTDKADQGGTVSACRFGECPNTNSHRSITLVTVVSLNRLQGLERICEVWPGSVIAVISVGDFDPMNTTGFVPGSEQAHSTMFCAHAVVVSGENNGAQFPINKLRNRGIAMVKTTHMIYLDVDFVPSNDLYSRLMSQLSRPELQEPNVAVVVPGFEFIAHQGKWNSSWLPEVPRHFADLTSCVEKDKCQLFHFNTFPRGHSTTQYDKWIAQGDDTREIICFKSDVYEPYLMIQNCGCMPKLFEEAFTGYGKNKIQMIEQLRYAGYTFRVLPKAFAIHLPHEESEARRSFISNGSKKEYVYNQYFAWKTELHKMYGRKYLLTPLCKEMSWYRKLIYTYT